VALDEAVVPLTEAAPLVEEVVVSLYTPVVVPDVDAVVSDEDRVV
jgi:hypothetical protein